MKSSLCLRGRLLALAMLILPFFVNEYAKAAESGNPIRSLIVKSACPPGASCCPPAVVGREFFFSVTAWDIYDVLNGWTGTVDFVSTDPNADLPAPYKFAVVDCGVHTFRVIFRTPGRQMILVRAPGNLNSGILYLDVQPAPASQMLSFSSVTMPERTFAGVTVDGQGRVWYSYFPSAGGSGGLGRIDSDGTRTEFPTPGATPTGLAYDGYSLSFSSPGDGGGIASSLGQMMDDGRFYLQHPFSYAPSTIRDVAYGATGLWWSDEVGWIGGRWGKIGICSNPAARGPFQIALDSKGDPWFTERLDSIGTVVLHSYIDEHPLPNPDSRPWGIAAGRDGGMWFTESGGKRIGRVDVEKHPPVITEFEIPSGSRGYGIAPGPDDNMWFSTDRGTLGVVDSSDGVRCPLFREYSLPLPSVAWKMARGPNSTLWGAGPGRLFRVEVRDCPPGPDLCLDGRFQARVEFENSATGGVSLATPVSRTATSGYFWFFSPNNVELMVKVVDGRAFNDHYWVFAGSLTNVGFTLTITDTFTGDVRTYRNPSGQLASIADAAAF